MRYTIPEILASRKTHDIGVVCAIILLGVVSFGLGRLSGIAVSEPSIALCEQSDASISTLAASVISSNDTKSAKAAEVADGAYVASKNGSAYHFPWCSGAQRIKEENKIWFSTKEEAESAGYKPASNCKGL